MRRTGLLLAGALGALALAEEPAPDLEARLRERAGEVLEKVARIRGLAPKQPVAIEVRGRDAIEAYVRERLEEEERERPIGPQERVFKRLGLLPEDVSLEAELLKVLRAQIGGYYDPERDTFIVADWIREDLQDQVMAHELTHALQDQHYQLDRFLVPIPGNQDAELARMALPEGDGTAVMLDYALEPQGTSFVDMGDLVALMQLGVASDTSGMAFPAGTPELLREMLLFPYAYGAAFIQHVRRHEPWSAVSRAYRDLPVSTEQILHPDKYWGRRDDPRRVVAAEEARRQGLSGEPGVTMVMGQFLTYLWMKGFLPQEEAAAAAAGWDGDEAALYGEGDGTVLLWASVWDGEAEAREFAAAARKALGAPKVQGPFRPEGFASPLGRAVVEQNGDAVVLVFRPAAPPAEPADEAH